jgi:hypothetical protein
VRSSPIAACAAALAIVAAGCASADASGPGSLKGAATVVPAGAVSFVAASADLTDSRWHGLGALVLKQVPPLARQLAAVAGDEVDVATLPGGETVTFLQPADDAKLAALVAKRGAKLRRLGDWTAVAGSEATLEAVAHAKSHLADTALFSEAMGKLPDSALVRVYANGDRAGSLFAAIPGQLEARFIPNGAHYKLRPNPPGVHTAYGVGTQEFRWFAAALTSSGDGLKLEAFAPAGDLVASRPPRLAVKPIQPYTANLVDEIPSGALAVVDIQVPQGAFELMPELPAPLKQLFGGTATVLPNQLDAVLGGETALYVRPGLPLPEITLVTQPADTAEASSSLDDLIALLPKTGPLAGLALHRAVIGGQLVVSTTQQGIDDFRGGGARLSSDPAFLAAREQSGMPDQTTGFAYMNANAALPLLALAGVKPPQGLPQLGAVTAYGAASGGTSTFTVFLGIG